MTIGVKARFIGGNTDRNTVSAYMGETFMERLEITLDRPTVVVPMYRPGELLAYRPGVDPVGSETRAAFGDRLRRAAREATRGVEEAILKELRSQGHLV